MSVQRDLMRQARESGLALLFNVITGLMIAVVVIIQAFFISVVIERVFLGMQSLLQVGSSIIWLAVFILIRSILVFLNDYSARAMAVRIKTNIRKRMLDKVNSQGPIHIMDEKRGLLLNNLTTGIESLDAFFSQYLPQVFLSTLIPMAILVAVFPREPLTGFILLGTAPLIPLFMALIGIMAEQRTSKQWQLLSRLSGRFYDSLRALELLKLINKQDQQADEIASTDIAYRKATMNVLQFTFLSAMVLELVATISTAIVAVEIGLRLLNGRMDFQTALFLLILAPEFYLPLRQLGVKYHAAMTGIQAAGSIFEYLQKPAIQVSILSDQSNILKPDKSTSIFPIIFDKVSASYPEAPQSSVEEIDLKIEEGKHYALVGPSGAGKTTLIYLLLKFLEPRSGLIMAGDHVLAARESSEWLEKIAWVPQNPHLLAGSVAYNITFREQGFDENRLRESLHQARMLDWISSLPDGWNSKVGELSSGISTGQAQRIALARAFYKDPPILLMDEPTSAVDPLLEKYLQETTRSLLRKRTSITIAHRLPTIYQSDEIIYLQSGRIVERGNHAALLSSQKSYFDFYQRYHHAA